jgi:hypothetical protein
MVKNMFSLLRGMYTFLDFTSQIAGRRGSLISQTRGSHTPIWCVGLAVTLKIDYYYYYYYYYYYCVNLKISLNV